MFISCKHTMNDESIAHYLFDFNKKIYTTWTNEGLAQCGWSLIVEATLSLLKDSGYQDIEVYYEYERCGYTYYLMEKNRELYYKLSHEDEWEPSFYGTLDELERIGYKKVTGYPSKLLAKIKRIESKHLCQTGNVQNVPA